MPTAPAPTQRCPRGRPAAVALAAALACGLSGCEYQYDDGSRTTATGPVTPTGGAISRDPALNRPVMGAELEQWAREILPATTAQIFQSRAGLLDAGADRTEATERLPAGTYALSLACRSTRRVAFTISDKESALVDLSLRCGSSRVTVVQLAADSVLTVKVEALAPANFAYRVGRL